MSSLSLYELVAKFEGVYDPGIFKAFFMAGGPGSGKSYVSSAVTGSSSGKFDKNLGEFRGGGTGVHGLKVVNSDEILEKLVSDVGMSLDVAGHSKSDTEQFTKLRGKAKSTVQKRQQIYLEGRLGLLLDGTGKNYEKIKKQSEGLKAIGYDTYMIFVNTSLETSLERNSMRSRSLPTDLVTKSWEEVQMNMGKFQNYFGAGNFILVDNNAANEDVLAKVFSKISKLVKAPVKNRRALQWIKDEKQKKKR